MDPRRLPRTICIPDFVTISAAFSFVTIPPVPIAVPCPPAKWPFFVRYLRNGIDKNLQSEHSLWIAVIKAVNIGQYNKQVGINILATTAERVSLSPN
jgi:hypothetical protein